MKNQKETGPGGTRRSRCACAAFLFAAVMGVAAGDVASGAPQANPDVTFHAPPRALPPGAVTADWPSLLGPAQNMTSPETRLRKDFSAGPPPLVWEMKKGDGYAPPSVVGDRLVLFHRVGNESVVDGLDPADGRRHWRFVSPTAYRDRYGHSPGPRCAPVVADGRVFALGADGRLDALDLATGRALWQHDLLAEFGVKQDFFGVGATPLVEAGNVIVMAGAPGGPTVVAFDAATGKRLWGAGKDWGPSYAAPVAATVHGRRRVFVFAGGESRPPTGGLLVVDPADGRVVSSFPWRGTRYESVNASAPVVVGTRVFVSECYGAGGVLLDLAADDTLRPVWTNAEFGTHFNTAVERGGFLYGVDGHGPGDAWLACVNLADGQTKWRAQPVWTDRIDTATGPREAKMGTYRSWLMPVDGRCLGLGEYGHLLWLDLSPDGYREASRARLFSADWTWSPPVLSRGLLYVCQNRPDPFGGTPPRLLCYDLRAAE